MLLQLLATPENLQGSRVESVFLSTVKESNVNPASHSQQIRALTSSTLAFTGCFAVWTIFSIIGLQIREQLNLNET